MMQKKKQFGEKEKLSLFLCNSNNMKHIYILKLSITLSVTKHLLQN